MFYCISETTLMSIYIYVYNPKKFNPHFTFIKYLLSNVLFTKYNKIRKYINDSQCDRIAKFTIFSTTL